LQIKGMPFTCYFKGIIFMTKEQISRKAETNACNVH
jgi:hypothetical protein